MSWVGTSPNLKTLDFRLEKAKTMSVRSSVNKLLYSTVVTIKFNKIYMLNSVVELLDLTVLQRIYNKQTTKQSCAKFLCWSIPIFVKSYDFIYKTFERLSETNQIFSTVIITQNTLVQLKVNTMWIMVDVGHKQFYGKRKFTTS